MKLLTVGLISCLLAFSAQAEKLTVSVCKQKVLEAEQKADPTIYEKCGFGNRRRAFNTWAEFVYQNRAKTALYEICRRYYDVPNVEYYCLKSAELRHLPAIIWMGDFYFKKGMYEKAVEFYTIAESQPQFKNMDEKGRLQENLGLLYLEPTFSLYDPKKAISFLKKASENRRPLSNNILAVLSANEEFDQIKEDKQILIYLWRAILLNCPTAQVNLGLYQLGLQGKLSWPLVLEKMKGGMYSCQLTTQLADFEKFNQTYQNEQECNCNNVIAQEEKYHSKPYLVMKITDNAGEATLKSKDGQEFTVKKGDPLPGDLQVYEIHKTAVILFKGNKERIILYLYERDKCYDICEPIISGVRSGEGIPENKLTIKPYLITFTPQECEDILYYAEKLVDTKRDYFGKKECAK